MTESNAPAEPGRWITRLLRRAGPAAALAIGLPLVSGALLLVQAGALAHVLGEIIERQASIASVIPAAALFAGMMVLRAALSALGEYFGMRGSETVKLWLRDAIIGKILARAPLWTAGKPSGALGAAVLEHVEALDGFLSRYMPALIQATILPIAFALVMFPVDWVVGLLFLVTAPLIPLFMALIGWGAEAASQKQAGALSRLTGYFADRLRGLATLRLFGRAEAETARAHAASEELRRRTMGVMRIAFLSSAVLEFFAALGVAGVALYVGLTFLDLVHLRGTGLSLEAGLFCLLMAPEVYQPLRQLAANYHDRASAKAAATELERLLDGLDFTVPAASAVVERTPAAAAVRLDRVSIAAPDGRVLLAGLDLAIAPGEHIAIMGQSGSGKSTLLEAIAGLRPHEGQLSVGGYRVSGWDGSRGIGMVGQRPALVAGTLAGNIRLGRPTACATAIARAADLAGVTAFASQLPQGLDTPLGENGIGLSGGERHRVALARLYLRDPGLILLDEPTAHLDDATEKRVIDSLKSFAEGRTMIVVTHSQRVAAAMDRTLRIDGTTLVPPATPARRGVA